MYPTLDDLAVIIGDDPVALRFIEKVETATVPPWAPELGSCLMWNRALDTTGYGTFRGSDPGWSTLDGSIPGERVRQRPAHIWLFERLNKRRVRPGHELDHICHDWKLCVPPKPNLDPHRACVIHASEKTVAENRLRADTVPGGNSRLKMRVLAGENPVWCRGKFGPHNLADQDNQYWVPKTNALQCKACHPFHVKAHEERKRLARLGSVTRGD